MCVVHDSADAAVCVNFLVDWINLIIGGPSGAGAIGRGVQPLSSTAIHLPHQHQGLPVMLSRAQQSIPNQKQLPAQIVESPGGYRMDAPNASQPAPMYKVKHDVTRPTDAEFRDLRQNLNVLSMTQLQVGYH
jgi:hypothetical protein